MKKILFCTLSLFISILNNQLHASTDMQKIDHSVNLTSTYRTTSGTEIVFDLDQCSRLGSITALIAGGGLCFAIENKKKEAVLPLLSVVASALLFKGSANIAMAMKEFERNEIARGIEHLSCHFPISLVHLYILLTRQTINDRLLFYRITNFAKGLTIVSGDPMDYVMTVLLNYVISEPFRFIKSCAYGNAPIRWS